MHIFKRTVSETMLLVVVSVGLQESTLHQVSLLEAVDAVVAQQAQRCSRLEVETLAVVDVACKPASVHFHAEQTVKVRAHTRVFTWNEQERRMEPRAFET